MARIVDDDLRLRIPHDVEIVLAEMPETTRGTSGSISAMMSVSTFWSMLTAPAVAPAPQPITRTFFGDFGTRSQWPSMRCRRMSCG